MDGHRKCSMSRHCQIFSLGRQGKIINLSLSHWLRITNSTQKAVIYHLKFVSCLYSEITAHAPASVLFSPWPWLCTFQPMTMVLFTCNNSTSVLFSPWPWPCSQPWPWLCTFQLMTMVLFTAHNPGPVLLHHSRDPLSTKVEISCFRLHV